LIWTGVKILLLILSSSLPDSLFMFELFWHHVYVRAESRTLRYLFTFERSREPCPTCLCSSGVENLPDTLFIFERSREPCATCLRSSGVENPALLYSLFMFERSREPFWHHVYVRAESRTLPYLFTFERSREPFLCSNLSDTMFTFERSREPFLVGKAESRTICYFSPCLCLSIRFIKTTSHTMFMFERSREPCATCLRSSGVENPVLLVYVRAESRTLFMFELSWHLVYVRAESRTFLTPCLCSSGVENPALLVYVRAESRTFFVRQAESRTLRYLTPCLRSSGVENPALLFSLFMFERSREPCATCLCSSGVENPALLVYVRAESRTFLLDRRSREPSFK